MTFAYVQVKALWSVLLRRFELELIDRHPEPNYATFVVGPKPPCRLRYRRKARAAVHVPGPSATLTRSVSEALADTSG